MAPQAAQNMSANDDIYDEEPEQDTIGGRLSRAREAAGLTTAQLAQRIGVKTSTVRAWENDQSEPRANRLNTLAGILGVSLSWLVYGAGIAPKDDMRADLVRLVTGHLEQMKRMRDETSSIIERLENELKRFDRHQ